MLTLFLWFVLARFIYIAHLTYVENRRLDPQFDPDQHQMQDVMSMDGWVMLPILGDLMLLFVLPAIIGMMISNLLMNRQEHKKVQEQLKNMEALERKVQEKEPESLKQRNKEMLKAIAEVNAIVNRKI